MKQANRKSKLSNRIAADARPGASEYTIWDRSLNHFGLRVYPSGVRSFIVQIRVNGRLRNFTLGRYPATSVVEARRRGAELLARIWAGESPAPVRESRAPLFRNFAVRYRKQRKSRWKPSSLETYDIYMRNRIMPHFGRLRLDAIDHARVSAWFDAASADKPGAANRAYEILRAMLNTARQWGEIDDSVADACAHVVKNPSKPVARHLSRDELNRLGAVLDRHQASDPWPVAAIRLLILTGARLSEVVNLKWEEIGELSEDGSTARLADSKTGPRTIWLGPDAVQLIDQLPRDHQSVRVFPGDLTADDVYRVWCKLREQAQLPGVRIHDCRHTWASQGLINGIGLPTVGRLLGHRNRRTTAIYAHLDDAALSDAATKVALTISRAMRYAVLPLSDNPSRDKHNQFPHRPAPPAKEFESRVPHLERDALGSTTRDLLADTSSGESVNPRTPVGLIEI